MSEHILIIEDDLDIANIERDYLMVAGYDVTIMTNGTDGIEAALNTPVDLIILDVMLPEMDGFEVCRQIRDKVRVLITLLFQRTARHSGLRRELVPAVLTLEGRRVALTALVDTGNTLTDPATGRPVMVAEGEKVGALFPDGQAPAPEELRRPVEALERLGRQGWQGRCRLLPYQAVGVECGMLLALRLDGARVGTEDYGKLLLALSPTRLTDGGGYHALIGT